MKTVLIDHHDSFTFNIVETLRQIDLTELTIVNHSNIILKNIKEFDKIILSPGPGIPSKYKKTIELVNEYFDSKPILGICLGHQLIAEFFGATLQNLKSVNHGLQEEILINPDSVLFNNIKNKTKVALYHSWCVNTKSFPNNLQITSTLKNDMITSFEHKNLPLYGIQFHPESFLSKDGKQLLTNFLNI